MSRKKVIPSNSKEISDAASANKDVRPRRQVRERLKTSVLEELWSIWRADPRVPSVKSRQQWAISRDASPHLVGGWFLRRRTCAKKAGQPLPEGSYDLPLDIPIAPKREPSPTPVDPEFEAVPDLSSDDTLVYFHDIDDLKDVEASSDTAFDGDTVEESKGTEMLAYMEVPQQPNTENQPKSSSADLDAAQDHPGEDTSFENASFPVCNQGLGKEPSFTCILCSNGSDQDEILPEAGAMFDWSWDASLPCPRLDFRSDTLSELSAIPFLFRTPSGALANDTVSSQGVNDWAVVEDELGRLVNEGGLDFSFLDEPGLASMELVT